MKRIYVIALIGLCFCFGISHARNIVFRGGVVDNTNHKPLLDSDADLQIVAIVLNAKYPIESTSYVSLKQNIHCNYSQDQICITKPKIRSVPYIQKITLRSKIRKRSYAITAYKDLILKLFYCKFHIESHSCISLKQNIHCNYSQDQICITKMQIRSVPYIQKITLRSKIKNRSYAITAYKDLILKLFY